MKALITLLTLGVIIFLLIPNTDIKKRYEAYFHTQQSAISSSLRVTYLGVSSLLFQDDKNSILIDGFFSRPSLANLLFLALQSDEKTITRILDKLSLTHLDAIIPLHSHHDHAMDIGLIAQKTGATIIGSNSSLNIAKAYVLPKEQLIEIKGKSTFHIGDFIITIIPSKHTSMGTVLGNIVGLGENITKVHEKREYLDAYKEGKTYSLHIKHPLHSVFINGSTAFEKNMTNNLEAQTVFLGIAKLGKAHPFVKEAYYEAMVNKLKAKRVIPVHWDNFTKSFDEPITPLPFLFDDFDASMEFLIKKSQQNQTELLLMDFFDTKELKTASSF